MKTIKINPADNVAVAIEPLKAGETIHIEGQTITLNNDVPAGHKILLSDLVEGENVIKYGYPIGHLKESHKQGDFICHDHIKTNLSGLLDYEYKPVGKEELTNPAYEEWFPKEQLTFQGYRRKNGEVGIRNEVWIVPTVGCVNGIVNQLANRLTQEVASQTSTLSSAEPNLKPQINAAYYKQLAFRIRQAHEEARLRTVRFMAFVEQELKKSDLPMTGEGSLGMLEAELYKQTDTVEREGGELKNRWQHCLATVTVRMMQMSHADDTHNR